MFTSLMDSLLTWVFAAPVELSSWSLMIVGFALTGQMLRSARSGVA